MLGLLPFGQGTISEGGAEEETGYLTQLTNSSFDDWPLQLSSEVDRTSYVKHLMSQQFLYVQFWLRPKSEFTTLAVSDAQQVVLELPRKLIEDWKAENPDQSVTDQSIAADIARVVAVDAIFSFPNRLEYEFDEPKWLEQRHPVMNARACDHHDNGIRAWVVKFSDATKVIETSPEANTNEGGAPRLLNYFPFTRDAIAAAVFSESLLDDFHL